MDFVIDHQTTKKKLRHPEKASNPDQISPPKPDWIRGIAPQGAVYDETAEIVRSEKLNTVCSEASCPNIGECWRRKHAAFMALGSVCSRGCAFCNVETGKPQPVDVDEPRHLAEAVKRMGLSHVVITSVTRDDLPDGGAQHFAEIVRALRASVPQCTIELLTPDFLRKEGAVDIILSAKPDVFNHNMETVPRLYPSVRSGARYFSSLSLLQKIKEKAPALFTKSGLMVGLGETDEELYQVMDDLRAADVDFLTIGQYLQPTLKHAKVERYVTPEEFEAYAVKARAKGFKMVSSSPLTRSSYHADRDFVELAKARS